MGLFQISVVKRELEKQDKSVVEKAYKRFKKYFFNSTIQQNIRESKEEQFQEGFLRELFVTVFGYTINPNPNYNLTTEYKNQSGAKKADAAILVKGDALAVIELKSTKTKDLEKIRQQAFDYKSHQPTCIYVITSNFERLRFYINNSVDYEEFDLFTISPEHFELLYFCLAKENLTENIPLQTKEASVQEEEQVTKKLYADYSLFKREIFRDIVKRNMNNPILRELTEKDIKKTLFKKTQKLLDRFLFIFFAEDRGLLPPNSISQIIDKWQDDVDFGEDKTLYTIYKSYFHVLNIGRPKQGKRQEIFAYNGGLFKPDAILDALDISNELLLKHTSKLTKYDFETDVDVNILGHIFENSLNEIESINAEIEGVEFDKQKTKRKKDGVFYTPKYITKYIVDNTIGKLCEDKKEDLGINDYDFTKNYILKKARVIEEKIRAKSSGGKEIFQIKKRKTNISVEGEEIIKNLDKYREWLLQLTICDPACGSGAFLNQALDFLISEHSLIAEQISSIQNYPAVIPNIENSILENNIYGVDLNEESVEIAKLSLWLRTAQKGRKLTSLSSNIKCGNSLIDSKAVAGDKAFDWEKEFPQVFKTKETKLTKKEVEEVEKFPDYLELIEQNAKLAQEKAEQSAKLSQEAIMYSKKVYELTQKQKSIVSEAGELYGINKGGFDVVIGNPPYVHLEAIKEESNKLSKLNYFTFSKRGDLYPLFVERGMSLLKKQGVISYIMPNKWLQAGYGKNLREYFLTKQLIKLIDFGDIQIFEGATTYPCIFISKNSAPEKQFSVSILKSSNAFDFETDVKNTAETFETNSFNENTWVISSKKEKEFLKQLSHKHKTLNSYIEKSSYRGILTGLSEAFIIDKNTRNKIIEEDNKALNIIHPFLQGRDIQPYVSPKASNYLLLFEKGFTKKQIGNCTEEQGWDWLKKTYPSITKWLSAFEEKGKKRTDKGDFWWEVRACDYYAEFHKPKIMYQKFQVKSCFVYDEQNLFCNDSMWIIPTVNKVFVAVLNSKMGWWLITKYCTQIQSGYQLIWKYFGNIPIPELSNPELLNSTELMINLQEKQQNVLNKLTNYLQSNYKIEKLSKKLQNWHELEFADFIKELNKAIKKAGGEKLRKTDEFEWMELFENKKDEAQKIKAEIDKTDKEIDQMVYELYGLTEEEIKIVENA